MRPVYFRRLFLIALVATSVLAAMGGWWLCRHSDSIVFLPANPGAEWIIAPTPPTAIGHWAAPVKNVFHRTFTLETLPGTATLKIYALRNASATINGHDVLGLNGSGKNWKLPATVDVANLLQPGSNEISVAVTNHLGPPALWLQLQAGIFSMGSDGRWQVATAGGFQHNAHLAKNPVPLPPGSQLYDAVRIPEALAKIWRPLALFFAIASGLVLLASRWRSLPPRLWRKLKPVYILFGFIVIIRTALFINDAMALPEWVGFDAPAHREHILFSQQPHAVTPAGVGWEMHQPPLYYSIAAGLMNVCGLSADQANALIPLRAVNGVLGLGLCWLALLCLQRLFPDNPSAQAVGLLAAAFLPPGLYLSLYLSNDLLAGLMVTTALYFLLRIFQSAEENLGLYFALGLALGLALLAKLSALPAVPVCLFALGWHQVLHKKHRAGDWLRSVGVSALVCLLVSGWFYLKSWLQTGALAIPHSDNSSWWQAPGFHTANYYFHFGSVLVSPLFSGFHSFADGIYSTLWGDGLVGGASELLFRPPWDYDLMKAGYLFSLAMTILGLVGMVVAIRSARRQRNLAWFTMITMVCIFALAVFCLTLLGPWMCQVKAFYAIPALLPFCAVIAAGWNWLAQKHRFIRAGLWVIILLWSLTAASTYWVKKNHPETLRSHALAELKANHFAAAIALLHAALQRAPDDFESRCTLGKALLFAGRPQESAEAFAQALELKPDAPDILDLLARLLMNGGKNERELAIKSAQKACQLTEYLDGNLMTTLALAYEKTGQCEAAIATATATCQLAADNGDNELLGQNRKLIASCQATKPAN